MAARYELRILMKESTTSLVVFILLCLAFSSLTACGGAGTNVANGNADRSAADGSTSPAGATTANFPPLATRLAEVEFENLDGSKFKISEKKGTVLLLNIWGIWCGPCRAEMPHLVELQDQYRDKGFEVIGLNVGDNELQPENIDAIKKFAANFNPPITYTLARSSTAATGEFYRVTKQQVVPQTLLVDREGKLRGMFIGGGGRVIESMKQTVEKTMSE